MKNLRSFRHFGLFALLLFLNALPVLAQLPPTAVPRLVNYPGKIVDGEGKPVSGPATVTFAIYKEELGGEALWRETQNVQADTNGSYTAQLGATEPNGLALDLFASGESRWLGVSINGGNEKPRALLLSVPYALKAADAETVGGYPASAFLLANSGKTGTASGSQPASASPGVTANPAITGVGAVNSVPLFDSASDIVNSSISQSGTNIGILTTTPTAALDVNGTATVRNTLTLVPHAADPALAVGGTKFSISPKGLVNFVGGQTYPGAGTINFVETASSSGLQGGGSTATVNLSVKPAGITTTMLQNSSVTLNTTAPLSGGGSVALGGTAPSLTLVPCPAGQSLVSSGTSWSCAAAAAGKVSSVGLSAPASDFTVAGGPITDSGTLALNWTALPTPFNTASAIVKRDPSGNFAANHIAVAQGVTAAATFGATGLSGTSDSGIGVYGESDGGANGANGVQGTSFAAGGSGVAGFNDNGGIGVYGEGSDGIVGIGDVGTAAVGVYGSGSTGVYGTGTVGFATDSNVQQAVEAGGWVKAMMHVNGSNPPYSITRCFNSTLTGAAATTAPCGFTLLETSLGSFNIGFNFKLSDRFFSTTLDGYSSLAGIVMPYPFSADVLNVSMYKTSGDQMSGSFYLLVY